MKYVSLFSGIEAASVAWESLGWTPIAFSEIDPFACQVLAHRYPYVPNLGDVTKIDGTQFRGYADVVVGGSPCQDVSIAGKRAGFEDGEGNLTRSGLFFEMARVVNEIQPRFWLLENVPGMLSSNKGKDITTVLDTFEELGYVVDGDILDAQFFGVPQRRRRVFIVGEHISHIRERDSESSRLTLIQCLAECAQILLVTGRDLDQGKKQTRPAWCSQAGLRRRERLFGFNQQHEWLSWATKLGWYPASLLATHPPDRSSEIDGPPQLALGPILHHCGHGDATVFEDMLTLAATVLLDLARITAQSSTDNPAHWAARTAVLATLEDYIAYGTRQSNGSLFDELDGIQSWRDFLPQALDSYNALRHP